MNIKFTQFNSTLTLLQRVSQLIPWSFARFWEQLLRRDRLRFCQRFVHRSRYQTKPARNNLTLAIRNFRIKRSTRKGSPKIIKSGTNYYYFLSFLQIVPYRSLWGPLRRLPTQRQPERERSTTSFFDDDLLITDWSIWIELWGKLMKLRKWMEWETKLSNSTSDKYSVNVDCCTVVFVFQFMFLFCKISGFVLNIFLLRFTEDIIFWILFRRITMKGSWHLSSTKKIVNLLIFGNFLKLKNK